jgi:hypothetical protein
MGKWFNRTGITLRCGLKGGTYGDLQWMVFWEVLNTGPGWNAQRSPLGTRLTSWIKLNAGRCPYGETLGGLVRL